MSNQHPVPVFKALLFPETGPRQEILIDGTLHGLQQALQLDELEWKTLASKEFCGHKMTLALVFDEGALCKRVKPPRNPHLDYLLGPVLLYAVRHSKGGDREDYVDYDRVITQEDLDTLIELHVSWRRLQDRATTVILANNAAGRELSAGLDALRGEIHRLEVAMAAIKLFSAV